MSIELMSLAWKNADLPAMELFVLISLADYANVDGEGVYPSIKTLATKCRLQTRQLQRYLRNLEDKQFIERVRTGSNVDGKNVTNQWRINVSRINGVSSETGGVVEDMGCHTRQGGGVVEDTGGVSYMTPYPSVNPSLQPNIYMAEPADILGQQHDTAPDEPPAGIDAVDKQLRAVTTAYEANIGMVTYTTSNQLIDLVDEYGADNVIRAIVDSARRNKRSIQYITTVLENAKRERTSNRGLAYRDPVTGEIKYAT